MILARPRPIQDPVRRSRYGLAVALILLISTALRLWQLGTPAAYMFDEIYYAKDAKAIVDGRVGPKPPLRWEAGDEVSWPHPEMGKFAIAAGILLFGDRAFGWRLPAVVAGVALLACVYPLARRLGLSPPWAVLALLLASADQLGITQSRIATLDIFIAAWSVICILFALRYVQDGWKPRWLFVCGFAGGMAVATKWSGGLAIVAAAFIMLAAWLIERHEAGEAAAARASDDEEGSATRDGSVGETFAATPVVGRVLTIFIALVIVPMVIYVLSYTQYFVSGHGWSDWIELHRQAVNFSLHLQATHTYASHAPTWIVDYRPVWYYFQGKTTYHGVIAMGNPFLWWLATISLVAAVVLVFARRSVTLLPVAAIIVVLYTPWFATTRTSFLYYMTPVAPFLAILVATALCMFAGGVLPHRGWWVAAGSALTAAVLWQPVGRLVGWLFWTVPRRVTPSLGWMVAGVGVLIVLAVLVALLSPRLKPYRPWMAMVVAGLTIGIVVAFIPIVLGLPISPTYFSRVMWFPNWI